MKIVCPHCGRVEIACAPGCGACLKPIPSGPWFAIETYLRRQELWSARTFGQGAQTVEITKHIQKELAEILAQPNDLTEWIDVVILALDGYWRAGGDPDAIMDYLQAKQNVNFTRAWQAPRDGEPTEHDRTGEAEILRAAARELETGKPFALAGEEGVPDRAADLRRIAAKRERMTDAKQTDHC